MNNNKKVVVDLREELVAIAIEWEEKYSVAPSITNSISEYDAAILVGHTLESYSQDRKNQTAVSRGVDIRFHGIRYQVKANRPSGRPGSFVTLVAKASNYDWDRLIWILYNQKFVIQEA